MGSRHNREIRTAGVVPAAVGIAIACSLFACVRKNPGEERAGPSSIRVTITEGDLGSPEERLPFSIDGASYTFDLEAVDLWGERDASFDGFIRIEAQPGDVFVTSAPEGSVSANVKMSAGLAEGVVALVSRAYGDAVIWAEDVGFTPAAPGEEAGCANREDDDDDGLYDFPADPGCFFANDDDENAGGYATGLSETLHYANPRLSDVQGQGSSTPLPGAGVTVDIGDPASPDVIVTRLAVDGMYLSDLRALDDSGHVFAFNFSTPERTRVCDRLSRIDGIVSEFFGFTELNFPSWQIVPWEGEAGDGTCPVPEPKLVDGALLNDIEAMERYEAALVRVLDVEVGQFVDCDLNDDGNVNFPDGSICDRECECSNQCEMSGNCTELTQYLEFGQWTAALSGGTGPKIFVVSNATVPQWDPVEHQGESVAFITGTLRQIQFIDPPWILEPRCPADLIAEGDPVPMDEACITSRTEDPDDVR